MKLFLHSIILFTLGLAQCPSVSAQSEHATVAEHKSMTGRTGGQDSPARALTATAAGGRPSEPTALSAAGNNPAEPLTLSAAVERAVAQSPELRRRHVLVERTRAQQAQARVLPNPVANYTREDLAADDRTYSEWSATLEYPLLSLMTRGTRSDAAKRAVVAAECRLARKEDDVRHDAQQRFLDLWAARRTLDAWQELETDVRRLTTVAKQRAAQGDISPYEQQRLRAELSRLQWRITEAVETRRSAESALAFTLGLPVDSLAGIPLEMPRLDAGPMNPGSLVEVGLRERADIQALQAERASLEHRSDWLRRRWMEDIMLGGGYKEQSDLFRGPVLSVSLPLPVFDRDQGNASAADAQRSALTIEQDALERQIAQDIHRAVSAYNALSEQTRQITALTKEESAQLLASATAAYTEGEFSLVEYIDAISAYMESAELGVRMRASLLRAAFALEHAVGRAVFTAIEEN